MARGGERGDIRHVGAGDEADARVAREPQQIDQPFAGDLLRDRCRRRHHVQPRVLIPRRRQPLGGRRRGQRAAGHEPEIPRACCRDHARLDR